MKAVNVASFENDVLKSDRPVLVEFWAEWCAPCTMMAAILKELEETFGDKFDFVQVNHDENESLSEKYDIKGLPTTLLFTDGEIKERFVGLVQKQNIYRVLEFHM